MADILPSCYAPTNARQRMWVSVQLAHCDYDLAGLVFPRECLSYQTLDKCLGVLETRPQWWTTYYRYHQSLAVVCEEYRPAQEQRQAIQLYRNLTSVFAEFTAQMNAAHRDMQVRVDAQMHDMWALRDMVESLARVSQDLENLGQQSQSLARHNAEALAVFGGELALARGALAVLGAELEGVQHIAAQIDEAQQQTLEHALSASQITRDTVDTLNSTFGALMDVAQRAALMLSLGFQWFWQIAVVVVVWLLCRGRGAQGRGARPAMAHTHDPLRYLY